VAVIACWRDKKRGTCAKRAEINKRFIVRHMVRAECEEKANEEYLVRHEINAISL
jgi:hypothetical protein